jgi:hypothetical protein
VGHCDVGLGYRHTSWPDDCGEVADVRLLIDHLQVLGNALVHAQVDQQQLHGKK